MANPSQFSRAIEFCRNNGYKGDISVITNGSLINNDMVQLFLRHQVHPSIPVFLIHGMSSNSEQNNRLIDFADAARKTNLPFSITQVWGTGESNVAEIQEFVRELGPNTILNAAILGVDRDDSPKFPQEAGNHTMRMDTDTYYRNAIRHPCLFGTIAVSADGNLLPCPFLKREVMSNIGVPDAIDEIFEEKIDKYWNLDLSQLEKCGHCEFRFGCYDCRAAEADLTGNLYGKTICTLKRLLIWMQEHGKS